LSVDVHRALNGRVSQHCQGTHVKV
jgi:hypothetical protein